MNSKGGDRPRVAPPHPFREVSLEMPTRLTMWTATPRCPGTPTNVTTHTPNVGLAKGTNETTTMQHVPCDRPCTWDHDAGAWCCQQHGIVLTGEQAAASWTETIELETVEAT